MQNAFDTAHVSYNNELSSKFKVLEFFVVVVFFFSSK